MRHDLRILFWSIYEQLQLSYHFTVDFVEVDFTDFVHNVFMFEGDERETYEQRKKKY